MGNIIYYYDERTGKVKFYPYAITDGDRIEPCATYGFAERKLTRPPYNSGDWSIIESVKPSEKLLETIKGMSFDTPDDAENFINGGGYLESVVSRVEDIEIVLAELIGGAE